MTDDDLRTLRALAEKATPGPWEWTGDSGIERHGEGRGIIWVPEDPEYYATHHYDDSEYIAAANPAAILALLDRLEAAERRATAAEGELAWCMADATKQSARLAAAERVVEAAKGMRRTKYSESQYWKGQTLLKLDAYDSVVRASTGKPE